MAANQILPPPFQHLSLWDFWKIPDLLMDYLNDFLELHGVSPKLSLLLREKEQVRSVEDFTKMKPSYLVKHVPGMDEDLAKRLVEGAHLVMSRIHEEGTELLTQIKCSSFICEEIAARDVTFRECLEKGQEKVFSRLRAPRMSTEVEYDLMDEIAEKIRVHDPGLVSVARGYAHFDDGEKLEAFTIKVCALSFDKVPRVKSAKKR